LACAWGKDNEPLAIESYIQYMATQNKGLIDNPRLSLFGASPDGLLTEYRDVKP